MQFESKDFLYVRRTNDSMYFRLKEEKQEHELPFETVLSYDKNIEFLDICSYIENNHNLYPEIALWKYIKVNVKDTAPAEKIYFTKYDKVYTNGTICIYKTKVPDHWVIWNRTKPYNTGSCVVKSKNYP